VDRFIGPSHTYDADATQLNSTAQPKNAWSEQRDVTVLMTSLHCHPHSGQLSWVELRRRRNRCEQRQAIRVIMSADKLQVTACHF